MIRWRRTAARVLTAALSAGAAVPLMTGTAWACSCIPQESEAARYRTMAKSPMVYVGTVLGEVDPPPPGQRAEEVSYRIRVDRSLKGAVAGTESTVTTLRSGASCGIPLAVGRVFLVGGEYTYSCSGTAQHNVDGEAARYARYNTRAIPYPDSPLRRLPPRTSAPSLPGRPALR